MKKWLVGALVIAVIIAAAIVIPIAIGDDDYEEPYAEFSADPLSGIEPLEVHFIDHSTGTVTFWEWDFNNDGTVDSTDQNPSYIYENPGEYTVSLTVGDVTWSTEAKTRYVSVSPIGIRTIDISREEDFDQDEPIDPVQPPEFIPTQAEFSANPKLGNAPLLVYFTDYSTGNITYREWDFNGDGTADSTEQNPTHLYVDAGTYEVSLTVRDTTSIPKTKIDNIVVLTPPQADFIAKPTWGEGIAKVRFTDMSTGNITYWEWDFDNDGTVDSTEQNPIHVYANVGTYTVSLTVSNLISSTMTKTDYINVEEEDTEEENGEAGGGEAPGGGGGGEEPGGG